MNERDRNIRAWERTPKQAKDRIAEFLERFGYSRRDVLNPELFRHFRAFANHLRRVGYAGAVPDGMHG